MKECYYTKALKQKYPEFRVIYTILEDTETYDLNLTTYLESRRKETEKFIKSNFPFLIEKSQQMEAFFKKLNAPSYPIKSLLKAINKGRSLKLINPLVDIIQFAELNNSILMGLHDLNKIKGNIYFDVLEKPETMESLFGKCILLNKGDIIIRDEVRVFASLARGPDNETKVTESSRDVIIFVFLYPFNVFEEGIKILNQSSKEIVSLTRAKILITAEAKERT